MFSNNNHYAHSHDQVHAAQMMAHMANMGNGMTQDTIFALRTAGQDSQCGLPFCCPGESVQCATSTSAFLPNELEGFITADELKAITTEVDYCHELIFFTIPNSA